MINSLLSSDLTYALAWTLLHSLWQIVAIACVLAIVLRIMKQKSAAARYMVSISAMAIVVVTALATFAIYMIESNDSVISFVTNSTARISLSSGKVSAFQSFLSGVEYYTPAIVNTWIIGSILFLIKLIGGYTYLARLASNSIPLDQRVFNALEKLKRQFDINRSVELCASNNVDSPMVMGFIRPIILFPIGLVNQLTSEEVAAVLAHELAHIKRHDFFLNILQAITESIFYYHPALWYISKQINTEREASCDAMAIDITGNKISYAQTLIKLQEIKQMIPSPALGMAGNAGQFSYRIKRILNLPTANSRLKERLMGFIVVCFGLGSMTGEQPAEIDYISSDMDVYIIDDCPADIQDIRYYLDTFPERNSFHVKKKSKNKELELHVEDGNVKELKIDGEVIPESEYDRLEEVINGLKPKDKQEMITVFPDCGDDFGNIYFLDKNRQAINLDSMLLNMDSKLKEFENHKADIFGFHVDRFDDHFIDSLRLGIKHLDWPALVGKNQIKIDSIMDLFPDISHQMQMFMPSPSFDNRDNIKAYKFDGNLENGFSRDLFRKETVADLIAAALVNDMLVEDMRNSKVELTGKALKINGEKQPYNIWKKYKKIYEDNTGITLSKKSKIELQVIPEQHLKHTY